MKLGFSFIMDIMITYFAIQGSVQYSQPILAQGSIANPARQSNIANPLPLGQCKRTPSPRAVYPTSSAIAIDVMLCEFMAF